MDTTQQHALVDEIIRLVQEPKNWLIVADCRCVHVTDKFSLYIERDSDTKKLYRITWQYPEKIVWERKRNTKGYITPGFERLEEACDTLFNFFHELLCEFTVSYIRGNWRGFRIGQPNTVGTEDKMVKHFRWLMDQEGLHGKWFWAYQSEIVWFEVDDDAALFKLARLGETQE